MLELHCLAGETEQDTTYLSSLEAAGWLGAVGAGLGLAREVAEEAAAGRTVVLREGEARAASLLVSSLAILLLSDQHRTREGLQVRRT